ncbi:MAG: T9SS type A sorting domain-containing protein [Bacteroidetes bacterium]|nr:T9SS type A sorting domain-containing protein [Bacteroidota bacterium]
MMNILGMEVYSKAYAAASSIDLSTLENGTYFIMLQTNDRTISWRVIKQ